MCAYVCVGMEQPEQSALHWVTLFNSAHTLICCIHTHTHTAPNSQRHLAREHTVVQTHHAYRRACRHTHTHTHTHTHAHPEAEGICCHWCYQRIKSADRESVCCLLSLVHEGVWFRSMMVCSCCIYITTACGVYIPQPTPRCARSSPQPGRDKQESIYGCDHSLQETSFIW